MKPARGASILADLQKAEPIAQAAPGVTLNAEPAHDVQAAPQAPSAPAAAAQVPAPQEAPANAVAVPQTVPPTAQWRTLPKKVQTVQFNVRIRSDLYERLKELATFSADGDSMTSIAARGIEKEIALMLFERGEPME